MYYTQHFRSVIGATSCKLESTKQQFQTMPQIDILTEPGPIPTDVQLRVFSNPICPYAQRVRLFAAAKGVKTEEINIHLKVKPEWYLAKINSVGKVPTIQLPDGRTVIESLVAAEYIDEAFGGKKLWPTDPYLRAQGRLLVDSFGNKFTPNYYKNYREQENNTHITELVKYLETLEEKLKTNAFFGGTDEPNAVDFLVWPWFERVEPIQELRPAFAEAVNKDKFPLLFKWISQMKENDAVKQSYLPPENHLAFIKSYTSSGTHDYSSADLTGKGVTIYTRKE